MKVSRMWFRIGLLAIMLSFVPWVGLALAPFVGLSVSEGVGLIGAAIVVAEVLFWAGLALAGKDTWHAVKAHGWRHAPRELTRLLVRGRPPAAERESYAARGSSSTVSAMASKTSQ